MFSRFGSRTKSPPLCAVSPRRVWKVLDETQRVARKVFFCLTGPYLDRT